MIESFAATWPLFYSAYLSGWLIALLLSLLGVLVVARDQIFVGAAVSQASMLGISAAMWLCSAALMGPLAVCESEALLSLSGGVLAVAAALLTAGGGSGRGESREAVTGWIFLVGASLSVLVLAQSPHGTEEVHRLLASSIIGASPADVAVFSVLLAVTSAAALAWHRLLLLVVLDPDMARAAGVRAGLWDRLLTCWLAVAVAFSIRVAGMVFTFGCLVLPALVAKNLCREVRWMFAVAPSTAVAICVAAFVAANFWDLPPGQLAVALLAAALAVAWCIRWGRGRRSSAHRLS